MALPIRFLQHSVLLGAGPTWINQIESAGLDGGVELFEESAGSTVDREYVAIRQVVPTIPLVTSDLSVLTTIGMAGYLMASATGAVVYGRELPFGGLPTAIGSLKHVTYAVSDGLIVPVSLTASHNQPAKLELMIHPALGSGGYSLATPVVRTALQAITAGAGALVNLYTTGPVKYTISGGASRLLQGIKDLRVEFGLQVLKDSDSGDVYPTHISIISRMAKIEFTTNDVEDITELGDGVSISSCATYFRAIAANGQRIAPATTSHVSVTGTAGMIYPGATSLRHKTPGTAAFTFTPALNTNLLTLSAAAAIPIS